MPPWGWPFAISIYGYMCLCACVYMHMHVWCVEDTPMLADAPTHLPPPQRHREPKTAKFNKSWTNRDDSILFKDFFTSEHFWTHIDYSWSPWIPPTHLPHPPRAEETQLRKITISLEWIKIIQFCLKICDPWTFLHTYRLGLMCRLGASYPKWHFYVSDPKKYIIFAPVTLW